MGIPINMNGVKAWEPGAVLSPGTHVVKVTEAKEEPASTGTPQIVLKMEAVAGDEIGGTISDWMTVTYNSRGRVLMIMQAFQVQVPEGDFNLEASWFVGHHAQITVRQEPSRKDPSKTFNSVAAYSPVEGAGPVASQQGDPLAQAAQQPAPQSEFAGVGASGGDFSPPPHTGGHYDDADIPF